MPCTKIQYSEAGVRIALSKITKNKKKHKGQRKRHEHSYYYCEQCQAYHLTSLREFNGERNAH